MKYINEHLKRHLLSFFAYGTLLILAVTLVVFGFWAYYPYKSVTFNASPVYKVDSLVVHQGDMTTYTVDYCKYNNIIPTVKKTFEDGIVFVSENSRAVLAQGCHKQTIALKIPQTLPPGQYRLGIELVYEFNPINSARMKNYSNWFTVLRSNTGAYGDSTNNGNGPVTTLK
jgi:hypothetical protein